MGQACSTATTCRICLAPTTAWNNCLARRGITSAAAQVVRLRHPAWCCAEACESSRVWEHAANVFRAANWLRRKSTSGIGYATTLRNDAEHERFDTDFAVIPPLISTNSKPWRSSILCRRRKKWRGLRTSSTEGRVLSFQGAFVQKGQGRFNVHNG